MEEKLVRYCEIATSGLGLAESFRSRTRKSSGVWQRLPRAARTLAKARLANPRLNAATTPWFKNSSGDKKQVSVKTLLLRRTQIPSCDGALLLHPDSILG